MLRKSSYLLVLLSVVLCLKVGLAQVTTATISGTIRDETGAILPGVTVKVKNVETGITRTTITDDQGRYHAPNLALGDYEVQAELTGFQTGLRSGIKLTVGREAVVDFTLKVGEITEKVVVVGEAPLVNTTSSMLSELVDDKKIRDLPLNGRDYVQLATLQPGVYINKSQSRPTTSSGAQRGRGLQISISGGRPSQNNFRLDGVNVSDHANNTPGGAAGVNLGVDAIREFSVLTNTYSAEFGRSAGGVINAVTRSGTNEFHGSAWVFHRNDNLDARNFFDRGDPPEFKRNQFGFTAGGPIIKDKTFVFGSYEGLREILGISKTSTTLTQKAKAGNLDARNGGPVTVDPAVRPYLRFYPDPNGEIFPGGDTGRFTIATSQNTREDFFTIRMDHKVSDSDSLFGTYTFSDSTQSEPEQFRLLLVEAPARRQYVSFEETHIFSPRLVNSFRFGFNRSLVSNGITTAIDPAVADISLGFLPRRAMGGINVTGLSGLPGGPGAADFDLIAFNSFQWYDNVNYTIGRHSIKIGFSAERSLSNVNSTNAENGEFTFSSIRDFLTNRPDTFDSQLPGSDTVRGLRQSVFGGYIQDDIQIRRNFTLNLGLRYELATVPTEADNKVSVLKNLMDSQVIVGEKFWDNPTLRNFAPRLGFAWDPFGDGKTAIRGGFGIFYDLPLLHFLTLVSVRMPPFFRRTSVSPGPGGFPKGAFADIARGRVSLDVDTPEFDMSPAYRMQWNLNIQREILPNTVATVAYVAGRGIHLSRLGEDENLAIPEVRSDGSLFFPAGQRKRNPNFSRIRIWNFDGNSFYHSLQLGMNRRFTRGFQAQGSYTFSKSVDDSSVTFSNAEFTNTQANPFPFIRKLNRGLSDFDIRHAFVFNFTWDLPVPQLSGAARALLNGWQVGSIISASSGIPFSVGLAGDPARTLTRRRGLRSGQRPNLNPGFSNNPRVGDPNRWFDPAAFSFPEPGTLGNLGRNTLIGPGLATLDLVLVKNSYIRSISESFNVQFRFEAFNLFNRANFNNPGGGQLQIFDARGRLISDPGRISSTLTSSRQIQFGLKFIF